MVAVARIGVEIREGVGEMCLLVLQEPGNPRLPRLAKRTRHGMRLLSLHDDWMQAAIRNPGGRTETLLRQQVLEERRWWEAAGDEPPEAA